MNAKTLVLILLLLLTAVVLHVRGSGDPAIASRDLDELPAQVGRFHGQNLAITRDVLDVLGDGRFLNRTYTSGAQPPVDLLIAYYPSQRSGQSIHSPQNCLPGAGWAFDRSGTLEFRDAAGQPHRVAEYLISNGSSRMEVLYWYRSRGRDIASDYSAKMFLMLQAVRDGRTDGGLIRIMTPVGDGETQAMARARVRALAQSLDPLLPPFLPS